jgi:hypothetical protein
LRAILPFALLVGGFGDRLGEKLKNLQERTGAFHPTSEASFRGGMKRDAAASAAVIYFSD